MEGQRRFRERERRRVQAHALVSAAGAFRNEQRPLTHGGIIPKEKTQFLSMSK